MTNDELERVMNFIIERQEAFAEQMSAVAREQAALVQVQTSHDGRLTRLEEATIALTEAQGQASRELLNLAVQVDRIAEAVTVLLERAGGAKGDDQS